MFKNITQQVKKRLRDRSPFARPRLWSPTYRGPLEASVVGQAKAAHGILGALLYGADVSSILDPSVVSSHNDAGATGNAELIKQIEATITAQYMIPSGTSEIPIFVAPTFGQYKETGLLAGSFLNQSKAFHAAYHQSNFIENAGAATDGAELADFGFELKMRELAKTDQTARDLLKGPTASTMSGFNLVSDEETRAIFGDLTPEKICGYIGEMIRLWSFGVERSQAEIGILHSHGLPAGAYHDWLKSHMVDADALDQLPLAVIYGHAISAGISIGLSGSHTEMGKSGPCKPIMQLYHAYVGDKLNKEGIDLAAYVASGRTDLDEFLFSVDAFDWLFNEYITGNTRSVYSLVPWILLDSSFARDWWREEKTYAPTKQMIGAVCRLTDLVDKKWKDLYERSPVEAMLSRFGHPTFIKTDSLTVADWMPGGQVLGSGYAHVSQEGSYNVKIQLPMDSSGQPNQVSPWPTFINIQGVAFSPSSLLGLRQLAESSSLTYDCWHVQQNFGLKTDSLYTLAYLSSVPAISRTGSSQDDYSGLVRGGQFESINKVELGSTTASFLYPSLRGKITAIRKESHELIGLASAGGSISLKEIDLNNWRLSRMSDLRGVPCEHQDCDLEHGETVSRSWGEKLARELSNKGDLEGVTNYHQMYDFVRPALPYGRADALAMYMTSPGKYLRSTGKGLDIAGLNEFNESGGVPKSVFRKVVSGAYMAVEFEDVALGEVNGFRYVASGIPGVISRNPDTLLFQGTAAYSCHIGESDMKAEAHRGICQKKFTHVSPGRFGVGRPCYILMTRGHEADSWLNMRFGSQAISARPILQQSPTAKKNNAQWVSLGQSNTSTVPKGLASRSPCAFIGNDLVQSHLVNFLNTDDLTRQYIYNAMMASGQALTENFATTLWAAHLDYSTVVDEFLYAGDLSLTGTNYDELTSPLSDPRAELETRGIPEEVLMGSYYPKAGCFRVSSSDHVLNLETGLLFAAPGFGPTGAERLPLRVLPKHLSSSPISVNLFYEADLLTVKLLSDGLLTLNVDGSSRRSVACDAYVNTIWDETCPDSLDIDDVAFSILRLVRHPSVILSSLLFGAGKHWWNVHASYAMHHTTIMQILYAQDDPSLAEHLPLARRCAEVIDVAKAHFADPTNTLHRYMYEFLPEVHKIVAANKIGHRVETRFLFTEVAPPALNLHPGKVA